MSTKNQQTNQYNQAGMNAYNSMMPGFSSAVNGYMNNPFGNPFFQMQQQMGTSQANNMGQSAMSSMLGNMNMSGIQQNSPAALEMINNQQRQNSSNRANLGFLQPTQNALSLQQNAMGIASNFKPLQTGTTQTQSGLGSWLPQVAGAALGAIGGGLTGGMSMLGGGMINGMAGLGSSGQYGPGFGSGQYGSSLMNNSGGYNFSSNPFLAQNPGLPQ